MPKLKRFPTPSKNGHTAILTEARRLLARGFSVVPVDGKKAYTPGWNEKRFTEAELETALKGTKRNIAIALNQSDLIDAECDSDEAETNLQAMFGGEIPPTPTWRSSRGCHRLFRQPPGLPVIAVVKVDGVEFRIGNGKGAYSVVPPSVHPDGAHYKWLPGLSLDDVDPAELPDRVVRQLRSTESRPATNVAAEADISEGDRNNALFKVACKLYRGGLSFDSVERALQIENTARCKPPLSRTEVTSIAKYALAQQESVSAATVPIHSNPAPFGAPPRLAGEPKLIDAIRKDISAIGLVGESDAGLLVYLAYSSRQLNRPLSVIIKGPSGSGKDEIQRRPADLMPPEVIISAMSLTPQALYYGEPDWLKHKIVIGGERSHQDDDVQRDRTAAIRQMLSHGFITKQTVADSKTVTLRQDGPISYSETTTKESIFREDANRCIQISTNAGTLLTARVLKATAAEYLPGPIVAKVGHEEVCQRHHEFQRALQYCDVRIPFAEKLASAMPTDRIEVRRVFRQVLALIEVIAWLHQFHRDRNEHGQLLATTDDYELARKLVLGPLHAAIGLGKDYSQCTAFAAKLPKKEFSSNDALKFLGANSRKVCHDWLNKLADMGVIRCVAEGHGNQPARWNTTGKSVDELLLPSVATVRDYVSALPDQP